MLCGLLFAATAINSVDRQMISVPTPLLQADLGPDDRLFHYMGQEGAWHIVLANEEAVILPPLRLNARLKRAPPSSSTPRVRSLPSLARRNVDFSVGKRLDARHLEFVDVVLGYQAVRRDANL
ncbi:hypothetical protein [Sphingomonas sp. PWP1-2]|uniref:hypothetical protein n=1 Tax=Sphingomonas sp. PWP1-2 TaxID=2804558 RepID=UPI003CF00009